MNKKSIGILIILGIVILGVSISMNSEEKDDNVVFHITLADPELYTNGICNLIYEEKKYRDFNNFGRNNFGRIYFN